MRYERFVYVNGFNYLSVKIINSIGNLKKSDAFDCNKKIITVCCGTHQLTYVKPKHRQLRSNVMKYETPCQ